MPDVKLESDARFTYWPPCMECQVSSLESDVKFTHWPPCMECQVSSLESDVRFTYWPPSMECQVSSLEPDVRFTNWPPCIECQVSSWNLMSGLPTGLHPLNARCQAWSLCQVYLLASMHGRLGDKPGI